jgi:hypothetical protein
VIGLRNIHHITKSIIIASHSVNFQTNKFNSIQIDEITEFMTHERKSHRFHCWQQVLAKVAKG